jgi:5-methylcytosine-specific restriction endonuclease McrA
MPRHILEDGTPAEMMRQGKSYLGGIGYMERRPWPNRLKNGGSGETSAVGEAAMSAPANPIRDLTGKNIRCWFVVSYAGERDGVRYWRCMCRAYLMAEKVIPETDLLDRKVNSLSSFMGLLQEAEESPADWIYGEWTVLGPAGKHLPETPSEPELFWRCRCTCGTERDIPQSALTSVEPQTLSCGCRPNAEVRGEMREKKWQAYRGFVQAWGAAWRHKSERECDKEWTREMDQSLRRFQTACVLCGDTDDLTTHHLRPLSEGHGLKPGNAVRLCRSCNSFIYMRDPSQLAPSQARKLETAAAHFKEYWESGCAIPAVPVPGLAEDALKMPDSAIVALLSALERGDSTAILGLAGLLEERGDPRAPAIRDVITLEAFLREKNAGRDEQRLREFIGHRQREAVWQRLGLTWSTRDTVKQYLGINPAGVAASVEEIAQRVGVKVQTARHRIELALHRLTLPTLHTGQH